MATDNNRPLLTESRGGAGELRSKDLGRVLQIIFIGYRSTLLTTLDIQTFDTLRALFAFLGWLFSVFSALGEKANSWHFHSFTNTE